MKNVLIALICVTSLNLYSKCPVRLSVGWETAKPFQFIENNKLTGLDIEILENVLLELGCKADFKEIPWERHLHYVEEGTVDIALGANETPERKKYANFSIPYITEYIYFYTLKSEISKYQFKNEKELGDLNLSLGVISGAFLGDEFQKLIDNKILVKNKNLFEVNSEKQLVEMLLSHKIKGFILGEYAPHLHQDILPHKQKMFEHSTHIMLSKKSIPGPFITEINKAIKKLKSKKIIQGLQNKYYEKKDIKY